MLAIATKEAGPPAQPLPGLAAQLEPPPLFRKLSAADVEALEAHCLRLGPEDRRMRFCGFVSDESVRAHCRALVGAKGVVLGAFVMGELRAAAELCVEPGTLPRQAEFALTVELPFQGRGLGTELLRRSLVVARNRAVATVTMVCLVENLRMRTIARKFDTALEIEDGMIEGRLRAAWPTLPSLLEELSWEGVAALRAAVGS